MVKRIAQQPLLFFEGDKLLCYHHSVLSLLDTNSWKPLWKVDLNLGWKERWLSRVSLCRRALRLGIRNAHLLDNDKILLFTNKQFYEFDVNLNHLEAGYVPEAGVRALNITTIKDIAGFDDMVVFGGYRSNRNKLPVHIYRRIDAKKWEPIYTFGQGEVNHIHNVIPDEINQCVWIQTGDFGDGAALWKAKDNFRHVEPILKGSQEYRGCVCFPLQEGLLYATDTPLDYNSIRLFECKDSEWKSKKISDISGSCIYACKVENKYLFSTAVEPTGQEGGWKGLFSRKRGSGIKDNYCHLYYGDLEGGFSEIYKAKKDCLPYALFQFGSLQFPSGENRIDKIMVYHVSTTKHENKMIIL